MMLLPGKARAVSPYNILEERAARFFNQQEWNQAAAVYDLMIDEKGNIPEVYGHAVVANAMRGDSIAQMRLMAKALDNHVPFDSVFSRVRQCSFSLGKANLYERFLTGVRATYPWMKRNIDSQLLNYYTFRRDGAMTTRYADMMLDGAPDNINFLLLKASGLVQSGLMDRAMQTYSEVLALDPDNIPALLNLGNYYYQTGDPTRARPYLERAYTLRPTPYLATLLAR